MSLLVDLFGYLSIVLHGLTIVAQSMTLGGVLFLALLARPLQRPLGPAGEAITRGCVRITAWSALGLVLCEASSVALQAAVLVGTVDLPIMEALGANFAIAGMVKAAMAALIGLTLVARGTRAPVSFLLILGAVELAAATLTTHAAARLDDRAILLIVAGLHQLGAAIWIGGLPCFLLALARVHDGAAWRLVGARFSRMSMTGVACILASGIVMSVFYVGSWEGFYGTAYGVMVGAKIAMFLMLLGLGGMNFLLVERLRGNPATPVNRLKRFAEVEVGIGFTIFFAAASLTSVPPAVDLTQDRVSFHEIVERNTPVWPRLTSPDHDVLALPALQAQLDAQAQKSHTHEAEAFTPGAGELAPRNAADIAWSEYNHHWAGIFVLAIGLLALLNQAGLRWARHWPLLFLGLAGFLFVRSDPENWPLGHIGLIESLRDVEVLQHRVFVVLLIAFAFFEWRVRVSPRPRPLASLVFPLICAGGGALLLTHSHAIANIKEALLIELTHTPLALCAVLAGWSRWLELRLDPPGNRIAGWVWPVCLLLVGLLLLNYREA
ncbi:MAG: CopD family protein [Alphaproteobacteria bacterium]|nr:CopD family protein [Alphaproteobacteria bacterium]